MKYFSYPEGLPHAFNDQTRLLLGRHGLEYAFSYYGRFCNFDDWDPYDVRRVAVETDVSLNLFRAVLTVPRIFA